MLSSHRALILFKKVVKDNCKLQVYPVAARDGYWLPRRVTRLEGWFIPREDPETERLLERLRNARKREGKTINKRCQMPH